MCRTPLTKNVGVPFTPLRMPLMKSSRMRVRDLWFARVGAARFPTLRARPVWAAFLGSVLGSGVHAWVCLRTLVRATFPFEA